MVPLRAQTTVLCCWLAFSATDFIMTTVRSQVLQTEEMEYIFHYIVDTEQRHLSVHDANPDPEIADLIIGVGFRLNTSTAREEFEYALPSVDFNDVYHGESNLTEAEADHLFRVATLPSLVNRTESIFSDFGVYTIDVKAALARLIFANTRGDDIIRLINDPDVTWIQVCVQLMTQDDDRYHDEYEPEAHENAERLKSTCSVFFNYGQSLDIHVAIATYNPCDDKYAHFYPFGLEVGDNNNLLGDEVNSGQVNISDKFTFLNEMFDSLWINTNGIISFESDLSNVVPGDRPVAGYDVSSIAPFWADVNTWEGGEVFWRETADDHILQRATGDVRRYFLEHARFTATWSLIATWDSVGYYGSLNPDLVNTFQAVLVMDGRHSFVLFNYGDIEWTTGVSGGGDPFTGRGGTVARMGFNVWPEDGTSFYLMNKTDIDSVIEIENATNVDVQGRFAFRVDSHQIDDPACENQDIPIIYPFAGTMLGGQEVSVQGPCYDSNSDIICRFGNQDVVGTLDGLLTAKCITPVFYRIGRIPLLVSTDGGRTFPFGTTYTILNVGDTSPEVNRVNIPSWYTADEAEISWDTSLLRSRFVDIHLLGYSEDPDAGTFGWRPCLTISLQHDQLSSGGRFRFRTRMGGFTSDLGAIRISVHDSRGTGLFSLPGIWSDMHDVSWNYVTDSHEWCQQWSARQENQPPLDNIESTCPCTWSQARADLGRFSSLPFCRFDGEDQQKCLYQSGEVNCVRSEKIGDHGSGLECCYSSQGSLLDSRDTFDAGPSYLRHQDGVWPHSAPGRIPYLSHFIADLLPRRRCCLASNFSSDCRAYFERRPSGNCKSYEPPQPATLFGDTHIITFDGLPYSLAGHGEFTVLDIDIGNFVVQGRISADNEGPGATFSALAMKGNATATVHVGKSGDDVLNVYIRPDESEVWEMVHFEEGSIWRFEGLTIIKRSNIAVPNVLVSFNTGLAVDVSVYGNKMATIFLGPPAHKFETRGLMGTWNDDPDDDFMTPEGVSISTESSTEAVRLNLEKKWILTRNDSLFYYGDGDGAKNGEDVVGDTNDTVHVVVVCLSNGQCLSENVSAEAAAETTASLSDAVNAYEETFNDTRPVASCDYLATPPNAVKDFGWSYTSGSTIGFQCVTGYTTSGSSIRRCQDDGSWDGADMTCDIISCSEISAPANGVKYGDNYTYGSVVSFDCDIGYDLRGDTELRCLASGSWDSKPPFCQIISCPSIQNPSNGMFIGDEFVYGSTVEFACNEGYSVNGSSSLLCTSSGMWSDEAPTCEINLCPAVGAPLHGFIVNEAPVYTYRYDVYFECDEGYILRGVDKISCLANRTWEGDIPVCQIVSCPALQRPPYGDIVEPYEEEFGSSVEFACEEGYNLWGDGTIACLSSGDWNASAPTCQIVSCGGLPTPNNGGVDSNGTEYLSVSSFHCDMGYNRIGPAFRVCQADGRWDGENVTCQIKVCPSLQTPENGSMTADSFEYNSLVAFRCDDGFILNGSTVLRCLGNGRWDERPPYCEIKSCGAVYAPANGSIIGDSFEFGNVVTFQCDVGFSLNGPVEARCLANASWDTAQPSCDINTCASIGSPSNGNFSAEGYVYGSRGYFNCNRDYRLVGAKEIFCLADGIWSDQAPLCERITCGRLKPPQNGTLIGYREDAYPVHSSVVVICHLGFQIQRNGNDSDKITCSSYGTWDNDVPTCEIIQCGSLVAPINGTMHGNTWTYGSVITFDCEGGLSLVGHNATACGGNAKWSNDVPLCKYDDEGLPPKPGTSDNQAIIIAVATVSVFFIVFTSAVVACYFYKYFHRHALLV